MVAPISTIFRKPSFLRARSKPAKTSSVAPIPSCTPHRCQYITKRARTRSRFRRRPYLREGTATLGRSVDNEVESLKVRDESSS